MKRKLTFIKCLVSVGFLILLSRMVNAEGFLKMFSHIELFPLTLSILVSVGMILVSCLKWNILLGKAPPNMRFSFLVKLYLVGYYFSNLLPSNIGGDVFRVFYLGKAIKSQSRAAASVFVERFTGFLFLLVLVIIMPLFKKTMYQHPAIFLPSLGAFSVLAFLAWCSAFNNPLAKLERVAFGIIDFLRCRLQCSLKGYDVLKKITIRFFEAIQNFQEKTKQTISILKDDRKSLYSVMGLTVLFYMLTWGNIYFSFSVFGIAPGLINIVVLTPVAMLMAMLPVSLGSLGLAEGVFVFYFGLAGVPVESALAMSLFVRFKVIVVSVLGMIFHFSMEQGKTGRSDRRA
ncbi:MAG: flippase-like domain-containing protein [Kiritimatiellae bacterium]|nr:flippase-like domain-containing protein [Kiritimatiellia bacterium]